MNRLDEAIGLMQFSVSRDLQFHIQDLDTPKEVWDKLASLFDKHMSKSGVMTKSGVHPVYL